jgi:cytochrome c-type biogenesis protein CcmH/NrfF
LHRAEQVVRSVKVNPPFDIRTVLLWTASIAVNDVAFSADE